MKILPVFVFLIITTTLEVSGDALVRIGIHNHAGMMRFGLFLAGAVLLFGYGFALNMAPVEFNQVVGLYIATLFIVWHVLSFLIFKSVPTPQIIIGGSLIVAGGLLVTFWQPVLK